MIVGRVSNGVAVAAAREAVGEGMGADTVAGGGGAGDAVRGSLPRQAVANIKAMDAARAIAIRRSPGDI